jgi:hypothetical protein
VPARHIRLSAPLAAIAVAALLGACGDDDTDTAKAPTAASTTQAKVSPSAALVDVPGEAAKAVTPNAVSSKSDGGRPQSYCSPSGDYCVGVRSTGSAFLLSIATFSFSGRYKLCVTGPAGRGCKTFRLRRNGKLNASTIRFTPPTSGRHRATWSYGGATLRSLSFSD